MISENIVINRNYSWIDIENPLKVDFDFLKNEFHLPLLLVQDCLKPSHLPKHEAMESGHFFLCRAFDPSSKNDDITVQRLTNKVALFISKERLISMHSVDLRFMRKFAVSAKRLNYPTDLFLLTHQLLRAVVETYNEPLTRLQNQYEEFEHEVLSRSTASLSTHRVYQFRRQLFVLRGILKQTQAALHHGKDFWSSTPSLIQDLREDIEQLYFRLDDISHNFDQLFALYLSINEQKNNQVMKVLTVFASVLLPLTFVASFYGMNFYNLPGIHTNVGLILLTLFMFLMSGITIWYFKRRGWFLNEVR